MFLPKRKTGGKDKLRVSCGTPTTRSLVLFGLINREFVENHFAISRRSLLRVRNGKADVSRGKSQKQLGVVYIAHGFALLRYTSHFFGFRLAGIEPRPNQM